MTDTRTYVVKNIARIPDGFSEVQDYLTSSEGKGVSRHTIVGFSYERACEVAVEFGMDPEEAVEVAPDDIVVKLDASARKLPGGEPAVLSQSVTGIVSM